MRHLLLLAPVLLAATAPRSFTVGGRVFGSLQAAVDAIGSGAGTITVAPGTYRQCAVQRGGRVTIRAAQPGTAVFEGTVCEGKAALVLRGQATQVDGLVFRGYRVGDGNGAGIRSETGDLTVTNAMFLDSQQGIGGGWAGPQRITIDHSSFAGLGQCDEATNCAHAIYLKTGGRVSVTNSRFERGTGGHYVKIRAPWVQVDGNSFDDSRGSRTNYMIDLPEGATGSIRGNAFVQGPRKENGSTLIAVGAEARTYRSAGLAIAGNEAGLAAGAHEQPFLVADWTGERLAIGQNRLVGVRPFVRR